jgi:hypothetical protein
MLQNITIVVLGSLLIFTACKSEKESVQTEMQAAHGAAATEGTVVYQPPAEWIKEGQGGAADAELGVFVFPGSGGAVQANIDRWVNQFTQPDGSASNEKAEISKIDNHGLQSTLVYVTGTYMKGAMGGPMSGTEEELPGYAMMAAIVETSGDPWFFKAVGPQRTIDYWRPSFETFIKTVFENKN